MNEDTGGGRWRSRRRMGWLAAALAGTALLAAGCGGGSPSAAPSTSSGQLTAQTIDAFAQCMRSHGVPDFYFSRAGSSSSSGLTDVLKLGPWVAPANPASPQFQSAMNACQRLLPIPPLTAAEVQQQLRRQVKAAACMRAHGFPDFPDPSVQNGHFVRPPLPSSIDTSSPQFQSALEACNRG